MNSILTFVFVLFICLAAKVQHGNKKVKLEHVTMGVDTEVIVKHKKKRCTFKYVYEF